MTGPVRASGRDLLTLAGIVRADRGEPPVLADFDKRSAHYQVLDRRDQPR